MCDCLCSSWLKRAVTDWTCVFVSLKQLFSFKLAVNEAFRESGLNSKFKKGLMILGTFSTNDVHRLHNVFNAN